MSGAGIFSKDAKMGLYTIVWISSLIKTGVEATRSVLFHFYISDY